MPSHRRPPQRQLRRARHRHRRRRQSARLTVAVAAATGVVAGGVSAGVALAAVPAASPATSATVGAGARHDASIRPGAGVRSPLTGGSARASQQGTAGRQASPAVPAASPTPRVAASASAAARASAAAQPYLIYDSANPAALPAGHVIATYATGPHAISPSQVAGRGPVLWIDIEATDPAAQVLDIEPGCATPGSAPGWVSQRLSANPGALAILYTSLSEWPAVQQAVATLPAAMRAQIRWWIADPTGYPHIVPGSDATQWYWGPNYDISTATPRF